MTKYAAPPANVTLAGPHILTEIRLSGDAALLMSIFPMEEGSFVPFPLMQAGAFKGFEV